MKYVGNLWDEKAMHMRMEKIMDIEKNMGVMFRMYVFLLSPRHLTV